jgi:hypothetical protein
MWWSVNGDFHDGGVLAGDFKQLAGMHHAHQPLHALEVHLKAYADGREARDGRRRSGLDAADRRTRALFFGSVM